MWTSWYSTQGDASVWALAITGSGATYAAGSSVTATGNINGLLIKTTVDGRRAWAKRWDGPEGLQDDWESVALGRSGNVYVAGDCDYLRRLGHGAGEVSKNGERLWVRTWTSAGSGRDYVEGVAADRQGNAWVAAYSEIAGGLSMATVSRWSPKGVRQFSDTVGLPTVPARFTTIAVDAGGNAYVGGSIDIGRVSGADMMVVKYTAAGTRSWLTRLEYDSEVDSARKVVLGDSTSVYVLGQLDELSSRGARQAGALRAAMSRARDRGSLASRSAWSRPPSPRAATADGSVRRARARRSWDDPDIPEVCTGGRAMGARLVLLLGSVVLALVAFSGLAASPAEARISTGDGSWVWQWPLPQGNGLNDVVFPGGAEGFSVGDAGTILATVDAGATWTSRVSGTRASLRAVDFVGALTGWAVGDAGTLARTSNGGGAWTVTSIGADDLLDVSFASATEGWALGARRPVDAGGSYTTVLYRTEDGGAVWTVQQTWGAQQFRALGFADASAGWVAGDGGRILRTTDGGASWTAQHTDAGGDLCAVSVLSASHAWVAGDGIYETLDGGTTWVSRATLDVRNNQFTSIASDGAVRVAATGWYSPDDEGAARCGMIATSADGGVTWTSHYEGDYLDGIFLSLAFSSSSDVCAVGDTGAVVRSSDGGVTWTGRTPQAQRELNSIAFAGPSYGWAVGAWFGPGDSSSLVLRTSDGGASWQETVLSPGFWDAGLSGVDFVSRRTGCAVGAAGLVLRTVDGGARWRTVRASRGGDDALYAVDLVTATRGWAVGTRGLVLTTRDGVRWSKQRSRTTDSLFGVSFASGRVGYAAGAAGRIIKTIDGGATWRRLSSGTRAALVAVDFADVSRGWAVGAGLAVATGDVVPVVVRTLDGGRTWKRQTLPRAASPTAVESLGHDAAWIATDDGTVFVTADGGESWQAQDSGVAGGSRGLAVVSSTEVWAAGAAGGVVRSATRPAGVRRGGR